MSDKELDINDEKVPIKDVLDHSKKQFEINAKVLEQYKENPEGAIKMVGSVLIATKTEVSEMNIMRNTGKPANNGDSFQTIVKTMDKLLDGFGANKLVQVGRVETEAGSEFSLVELARNATIKKELSHIEGFENFIEDRLLINNQIHEAREGQSLNSGRLKGIMDKTDEFINKYTSDTNKMNAVQEATKNIPSPIDQFKEKKELRADTKYQQMLKDLFKGNNELQSQIDIYIDPNSNKESISQADKVLKEAIQEQYGLNARIESYK